MKRLSQYWCGFLAATILWSAWGIYDLAISQTVRVDHSRGEIPIDVLDYAIGIEAFKTGMAYRRNSAGILPGERCIDGSITMRRQTWLENGTEFAAFSNNAAITYDCPGGNAAAILFHPLAPITLALIQHELNHTAGCWTHLDDPEDTMFWLADARNGLTQADILCALSTPFWPTVAPPDLCTTLILPDKSLYIPEIREHRARLELDHTDAAGRLVWRVAMATINIAPEGCPGYSIDGGVATIPAAWSPTFGLWTNVELLALPNGLWRFGGAD